jgi:hypothetical protein
MNSFASANNEDRTDFSVCMLSSFIMPCEVINPNMDESVYEPEYEAMMAHFAVKPKMAVSMFDVDTDDFDIVNGFESMFYQEEVNCFDNLSYNSALCQEEICQEDNLNNELDTDLLEPQCETFHVELKEVSNFISEHLLQPEVCSFIQEWDVESIDALFLKDINENKQGHVSYQAKYESFLFQIQHVNVSRDKLNLDPQVAVHSGLLEHLCDVQGFEFQNFPFDFQKCYEKINQLVSSYEIEPGCFLPRLVRVLKECDNLLLHSDQHLPYFTDFQIPNDSDGVDYFQYDVLIGHCSMFDCVGGSDIFSLPLIYGNENQIFDRGKW